jgi:uncharacterized membrane protein
MAMRTIDKKTWILAAVMLVMIVLLTWLVRIDIPLDRTANAGFWTIADACIYVAAVLLGGPLSALCAAVGSLLGDWFAGYTEYMLATFLIKGAMALFTAWYYKRGDGFMHKVKTFGIAGGGMITAYFIVDLLFIGGYYRAAIMLPINILQAAAGCLVAALVLIFVHGKSYQQKNDPFVQYERAQGSSRKLK